MNPTKDDFLIGKDFIDLRRGGDPERIADGDVQGVSTHLLRAVNWMESDRQRRVVEIEYREQDGSIRSAMVQQPVSEDCYDDLAEYARRVAISAAENSLAELAANDLVERRGFMINDQGMMLTASGETFCCGLFDIQVMDNAGERTLLWTDDVPEPAAILRMDDPNALTLSELLPKLITAPEDSQPRRIDQIRCDPRRVGRSKGMQVAALLIALFAGVSAAMLTANGMQAPKLPVLLGLIPVGIPIVLILVWEALRSVPTLAVFRNGICIGHKRQFSDVSWEEIESIQLTDREVNLGTGECPDYVRIYTLHLGTAGEHSFGKQIKLSWQLNETTQLCTDYLCDKVHRLQESRLRNLSPEASGDLHEKAVPTV